MKVRIVLSGRGGELDSEIVEISEGQDESASIRTKLLEMVAKYEWCIGDTLTIEEVE